MGINANGYSLKIVNGRVTYNAHTQFDITPYKYRLIPHVSLSDIGLLYANIGIAPTSGLYDTGTLCTSSAINQNSLVKPFYAEQPFYTKEDLVSLQIGGEVYPYGYSIPSTMATNAATLLTFFTGSGAEWVFHAPGAGSWKSLAHFDGYDDGAPAGTFPILTMTSRMPDNSSHELTLSWGGNRSASNVHPVNMADATMAVGGETLGSLKLGVAMYYSTNGLTWSYLKSVDSDKTAGALGAGGLIETKTYTLNIGVAQGNLPQGEMDVQLRCVPFLYSPSVASAQQAYTAAVRKWSIRMHDDKGYRDITLAAFTWGITDVHGAREGNTNVYKVSFTVRITGGQGAVTLEAHDFTVHVSKRPDLSGEVGQESEDYSSTCYVDPGMTSSFTLKNNGGATKTSETLKTASGFSLSPGTYDIQIAYRNQYKGFGTLIVQ